MEKQEVERQDENNDTSKPLYIKMGENFAKSTIINNDGGNINSTLEEINSNEKGHVSNFIYLLTKIVL